MSFAEPLGVDRAALDCAARDGRATRKEQRRWSTCHRRRTVRGRHVRIGGGDVRDEMYRHVRALVASGPQRHVHDRSYGWWFRGARPWERTARMTTLRTVGHGTLAAEAFAVAARRRAMSVASSMCGRSPAVGTTRSSVVKRWSAGFPKRGSAMSWIRDLGGRRRPSAGSKHVALRNDAFRAYADYMETEAFVTGVDELLAIAAQESIAVMCSESVWWRCHRRLLADHLVLVRGVDVSHLMHDGRAESPRSHRRRTRRWRSARVRRRDHAAALVG